MVAWFGLPRVVGQVFRKDPVKAHRSGPDAGRAYRNNRTKARKAAGIPKGCFCLCLVFLFALRNVWKHP